MTLKVTDNQHRWLS